MDIQRNDPIEQILKKLDMLSNPQHNMDQIMERLDTLQNTMERQNKKQNLLDKKLDSIGSMVTEMYQQQREAKEETAVKTAGQQGVQQGDTNEPFSDKRRLSLATWEKQIQAIRELEAKEETTVKTTMQHNALQGDINEPFTDKRRSSSTICEKQIQAIRDLEKKIEQINASASNLSRDIKTTLDTILATNKQFTVDLENTIRNRIAEMNDVSKGHSLSVNQAVRVDIDKLLETLKSEIHTIMQIVKSESDEQADRIVRAADSVKVDLRHMIKTEGDNINKCKVALGNVSSQITSLANSIDGNTATFLQEIGNSNASMSSGHSTVNKNLEELTTDLKYYIYQTKREIFAVIEKEAQIVRNRIEGPLPSQGKYTFDFFVKNFEKLVASGKRIQSFPWHINERQTCVNGSVALLTNGEMEVWLEFGRHPLEVGLQPRPSVTLKIKATICDINNEKLPSIDLGEASVNLVEAGIKSNSMWGFKLAVAPCGQLLQEGYGEEEGYGEGALLIRYEVTVL